MHLHRAGPLQAVLLRAASLVYWKKPLPVSSMPATYGRLASMAEKGAMTSPSYGLMMPEGKGQSSALK